MRCLNISSKLSVIALFLLITQQALSGSICGNLSITIVNETDKVFELIGGDVNLMHGSIYSGHSDIKQPLTKGASTELKIEQEDLRGPEVGINYQSVGGDKQITINLAAQQNWCVLAGGKINVYAHSSTDRVHIETQVEMGEFGSPGKMGRVKFRIFQ